MWVLFLKLSTTSEGRIHDVGDVAEIPDDLAADLIRRGIVLKSEPDEEVAHTP